MEYLRKYFDITLFYYNPNITDSIEYGKRMKEQKKLVEEYNQGGKEPIHFLEGVYEPDRFFKLQREWRKKRKGDFGVLPAMSCV